MLFSFERVELMKLMQEEMERKHQHFYERKKIKKNGSNSVQIKR